MRTIIRPIFAICAFLLVCAVLTGVSQAQDTRNSWFPQTNQPPLSPWLQMERKSTSELDTYHQFVRPRLEMESYLMAQRREMSRQRDRQAQMQSEINQVRDYQLTGSATSTGKKATYRNYSHYYNR